MSVFRDLYVRNNLTVDNDLIVNGTTTTVNTEHINLEDTHMYLNNKYQSTQGRSGGIMLNYKKFSNLTDSGVTFAGPSTITTTGSGTFAAVTTITIAGATETENNGTFTVNSHIGTTLLINETTLVAETTSSSLISSADTANTLEDTVAAGGFTSTTTVATTGTGIFADGDVVQFSATAPYNGNSANLGLFVVDDHSGNVLTIKTTAPASNYAQTAFVADTSTYVTSVNIDKVALTFMQSNDLGVWSTTSGATIGDITTNITEIGGGPFGSITLTDNDDQIIFNRNADAFTMTIDSEAVSADRVYSIPDVGADAEFVLSIGGVIPPSGDGITAHADTEPTLTTASTVIHTFTPSAARTATLPAVAAVGFTYKFIMLSGAGSVVITAPDGDIEGSSTLTLDVIGQHVSLTSDGAVWRVSL